MQMAENILVREHRLGRPDFVTPEFYSTIPFPNHTEAPPSPAPAPAPGPTPAPGPAACPKQQVVNGTTVCYEATDSMACTGRMTCPTGKRFATVDFASIGSPAGSCGHYQESASCHGTAGEAGAAVAKLCLGQTSCSVPANTDVLNPKDPNICSGVIKRTAVQLGCA